VAGDACQGALLGRVRGQFLLLLAVLAAVTALEVPAATTPWWPHRVVALLLVIGTAAAWTAAHRHRLPCGRFEVPSAAALVGVGVALDSHAAVIPLLAGLVMHRALHGTRGEVARGASLLLGGYLGLGVALEGMGHLLDPADAVVVLALVAVVAVLRRVAELLAWADLTAGWDQVLTETAADLAATEEPADVDEVVDRALDRLRVVAAGEAGGLWPEPPADDVVPSDAAALRRLPLPATSGHHAALDRTLRRLRTDDALARERVESATRFRLLAERSRDGIYLLELDDPPRFRYLNPAAEALIGLDAATVLADPQATLARLHPDDRARAAELRDTLGALLDPVQLRVRDAEGAWRWIEVVEAVVEQRPDAPTLVQGVVRDISRHRAHEQALHRALAQEQAAAYELRELDRMKSTFLQAVSHELRTPLTAVLGCAETLRDRRQELSDADADRLVRTAARQARRLSRLLEDLLDVDRLSSGQVEAVRAPVRLGAVVEGALDGIGDDRERVAVVVDDEVVEVDAAQVERIVENLLRNALRHTPAGTPIRLRAQVTAGAVRLVVEDDGPGVPPELRDRIFAPFTQGPTAGASPRPGTGIGLALVRQLARLHGGDARVEESTSGGARFVVDLPGPPAPSGRTTIRLDASDLAAAGR
jgi:PAS domain S-box-containing protein